MIKLVNVYPNAPITTINPPIRTRLNNINMSVEDIRKCLIATAYVEEILDGRKTIPLDFSNYDKDNDLIPAEVIKVTPEEKAKVEAPVVEKEAILAEDLKATITTDNAVNEEAASTNEVKEAEDTENKSVETKADADKHDEVKEDAKEQAPVEDKKESSNNNVKNNNLKKAYVKPQNKK